MTNQKDLKDYPIILEVEPHLMEIFHVGRVKAYELPKIPGFPSFKIGKSIKISRDALINWINNSANIGA